MAVVIEGSEVLHYSKSSILLIDQKHGTIIQATGGLHYSHFQPFLDLVLQVITMSIRYLELFDINRVFVFQVDFMGNEISSTYVVLVPTTDRVVFTHQIQVPLLKLWRHIVDVRVFPDKFPLGRRNFRSLLFGSYLLR